jgi:hypothetical protein
MNYSQLQQVIQDYSENTEALFVSNIPRFVMEAEDRIYNTVQLPALRKNVIGNVNLGNQYLSLPTDWLSTFSLAVIDSTGTYTYLLNKDVNYMREAYPNPSTAVGLPKYYSLFGPNSANKEDMTLILAPTPDQSYQSELHYFYYPDSIVQGQLTLTNTFTILATGAGYVNGIYYNVPLTGGSGSGATATVVIAQNGVSSITVANTGAYYVVGDLLTINSAYVGGTGTGASISVLNITNATGRSWLGDNYDPVLFYGAMREAVIFMKGEQDMVTYYEKMFQDAIGQLKRLGDGLERGDAYRDGQTKLRVNT